MINTFNYTIDMGFEGMRRESVKCFKLTIHMFEWRQLLLLCFIKGAKFLDYLLRLFRLYEVQNCSK
jgi:hypothetical protein